MQPQPKLALALRNAATKALGGGLAGALAMVVQVVALMWMRTTINYQHANGMGTMAALRKLYAEGGIARLYQGLWAALFQAPLSRFGDTAANAGMNALLEGVDLPPALKTLCASCSAAIFRIGITPVDTLKTTLQVRGAEGMAILSKRVAEEGPLTLYSGALGSSFATLVGHYPWFITYNFLNTRVPAAAGVLRQLRSALLGFCSSLTSDVVSNGVRVIKTAKQTSATPVSYTEAARQILEKDGLAGLLFRGLGTKILSNGLQAMLFTVCWRFFEERINAAVARRRALQESKKE
jgi:hypothetical protein